MKARTDPSGRSLFPYVVAAALLAAARPAAAGLHDRGNITLSVGGSMSQTTYRDRNVKTDTNLAEMYPWLTQEQLAEEQAKQDEANEGDNYSGTDVSLYLSSGYFFFNHIEVGLSGSGMLTQYHGGEQSDLHIYDGQLYTKYYFDRGTSLTPYVGLKGGYSYVNIGTYQETTRMAGFSTGLEVCGSGPYTVFLEYSSEYTFNGADLTGTEWKNRIYLGITWYFNLFEKKKAAADPANATARP